MTSTLVIMAAGMATRYGERMKQLEPVGPSGEVLMDYAVFDAARAGFSAVVLVIREEIESRVRTHTERWRHAGLSVTFVRQPLPGGVRTKPWGTAHAVLVCREAVAGPFAVCNADDFYGRSAWSSLGDFLSRPSGQAGLVGYPLNRTLSPYGGVSRGLCRVDGRMVRAIEEVTDIQAHGAGVAGRDGGGRVVALAPDAWVSMNLWGFTPDVFGLLAEQFSEFRQSVGNDRHREFLLGPAVSEAVCRGKLVLEILSGGERWFGMTFPEDRPTVGEHLHRLVAEGEYPATLF